MYMGASAAARTHVRRPAIRRHTARVRDGSGMAWRLYPVE